MACDAAFISDKIALFHILHNSYYNSYLDLSKLSGNSYAIANSEWVREKNEYDTRLAAAYAKYRVLLPDLTLRTAQAALTYLGIDAGPIDGLRGRRTTSALSEFQQTRGLPVSGNLDPDTEVKLLAEAVPS